MSIFQAIKDLIFGKPLVQQLEEIILHEEQEIKVGLQKVEEIIEQKVKKPRKKKEQ